jgi:hypothetical protein
MVASFSRVAAPSDGVANSKRALLLAPVKPKIVPQMQCQRRFFNFFISLAVYLNLVILSWILILLESFTTIMNPALNDHII